MDPLTALSLACNIITLTDAAIKTGKEFRELYESPSGRTRQSERQNEALVRFRNELQKIQPSHTQFAASKYFNKDAITAAECCSKTVGTIVGILNKCKVQEKGKSIATAKAWWQIVINKSKLERLQLDLESQTKHLGSLLAIETSAEVQRIKEILDVTDKKQDDLAKELEASAKKLDEIRRQLSQAEGSSTQLHTIMHTINQSLTVSESSMRAMNHAAILNSLRPTNIRFEEVHEAEADTFEWILEDPEAIFEEHPELSTTLVDWLRSGSGVFHITGKPGSGKSTLMKFLASHKTTRTLLNEWATGDKKQLIFSKFFFWRLGSGDQKTMNGLMRGILYDIVKENITAAEILFAGLWAPKRYASQAGHIPLPRVSESQVREAFGNLIDRETLLVEYRICLFIDGLDEYDEQHKSLWNFCKQLQAWAGRQSGNGRYIGRDNIKLCVSSREEPPILQALHLAYRITLHKLTRSDIAALVHDRLNNNPHFQALTQAEGGFGSESLRDNIVGNAQGVFLWVVLLLRWMEDDLATGTSFKALQTIVDTAPSELDEFFEQILKRIPQHHSRGAYLIFAMVLRQQGYRVSPGPPVRLRLPGAPIITTFGLSYIFDAFEGAGAQHLRFDFEVPDCRDKDEYNDRIAGATQKLRSWCKGLVEARRRHSPDACNNCGCAAVFAHRSIPDILSSRLQRAAGKWAIDDDWVTEGIIVVSLAESKILRLKSSLGNEYTQWTADNLRITLGIIAQTTPELSPKHLELLDKIDADRQRLKHDPSTAGSEFIQSQVDPDDSRVFFGDLCPLFPIAAGAPEPLTSYVLWKLRDPQIMQDPFHQLLMLCVVADAMRLSYLLGKFPDIAPILNATFSSGVSPNTKFPRLTRELGIVDNVFGRTINVEKWARALSSGHERLSTTSSSPWRVVLLSLLPLLAFTAKGSLPGIMWNQLQIWLQSGAEIPIEVVVIAVHTETRGHESPALAGFRFPGEKAKVARPSQDLRLESLARESREYFRAFRSTTMSSMIRWHNPPNASALLKYTDPVKTLGENTQEWNPFGGGTNHDVSNNRTPSQIKFARYMNPQLDYYFKPIDLSWSEDRKHWWNEDIEKFSGSED